MDTKWNLKNEIPQEEFISTIIDGVKSLSIVCPNLTPNICIGESNIGDFCAVCTKNPKAVVDAFPIQLDKEEFNNLKEMLREIGLNQPSELHLEVIASAIAVDYLNYHNKFKNKEEINGKFALYNSTFHTTDGMGDAIVIKDDNLGSVVVGYDVVKDIIIKLVGKRFKSDVA